jgi:hypothetical protein
LAQTQLVPLWKQQRLALALSLVAAFQSDFVLLRPAWAQTGVFAVPLENQ